jgi:23S rRNA (adenine2503-C2)-methyltransferase
MMENQLQVSQESISPLKIRRFDSSDTSVCKFVFEFDGAVAEAVLYKYPTYENRTVICCSTQSGCPIGCAFCGSGNFFIRNLTADEIVTQVETCVEHALEREPGLATADIQKFQIMFMSMGEPFLNWKHVEPAIRRLHDMYPTAALLLSTSAPRTYEAFSAVIDLGEEIEQLGLQVSVHEAFEEDRNKLIPFEKKMTFAEIAAIGQSWFEATGRRAYYNYCVHEGNGSDEHAIALTKTLVPKHWECTLSVICEKDETVASSAERQLDVINEFSGKLLALGQTTRVFNPAGQDDIGGGCGQLWFVQKFAEDHPELATISSGSKQRTSKDVVPDMDMY